MTNSSRGSALLESLPVLALLAVFVAGLGLAAYVLFARAWIQFQSEQALYCLAQSQSTQVCRIGLENKLRRFLPWGENSVQLASLQNKWNAEVQWSYRGYSFRIDKSLDPKLILAAKALRW